MATQPKNLRVIETKDGVRHRIVRRGRLYWVGNAGSSHMDGVKDLAEQMGGKVVSIPNPRYNPLHRIMNFFG
jgi:cell division ATPase FtsA